MDILDILLDILLKPPQPFIGLFLGHIVSKEGISTCPEKVHAVQEWPIPKTINDLRSFLGFVGYYRNS